MSNQEQIAQVAFCLHKLSGNLIIVGFAGQKSILQIFIYLAELGLSCSMQDL